MRPFHVDLSLDQLDWEDSTFAIHNFLPPSRLEISLEQHGILSTPWVWVKGNLRFAVVDGFSRLGWARRKGLEQVQCLVFPASWSHQELLILRVEGKLFGPPLNPAEKAQIIAQCIRVMPRELVLERILPALGIPQRNDAVASWSRLCEAGEALMTAAASGVIAERAALELSTWDAEERGEILAVLKELRCSASIQLEIAERIREIATREETSMSAVLQQAKLQAVLRDRRSNHRQKTEALRALLNHWRLPRLSAREEKFDHQWKAACLPRSISLLHPPAFEGDHWQLQITFSSPQDLKKLLERAKVFADSPLIAAILSGNDS